MDIYEATIIDVRRNTNEKRDITIVMFSLSDGRHSNYRLKIENNAFLLEKIFTYTDTISVDVKGLIGKKMRLCITKRQLAIGHVKDDRFVVLDYLKEMDRKEVERLLN